MASLPHEHLVLRFVHGKYNGQEFPVSEGRGVIIGRSSEADLVLADDAVSRKHARIYLDQGRAWVRDLGSRNGTLVNGARVDRRYLVAGDRIALGSSLARVEKRTTHARAVPRAGEAGRHRAHEPSGRSMSGSIAEIPLMDVLQWLATSRRSGCLRVRDPDRERTGALHLREGRVYYAEIGGIPGLHPEKALLRMLAWDDGTFELENTPIADPPIEIDLSLEHMLMEAARQQDELAELGKSGPIPDYGDPVIFANPSPIPWRDLPPAELELVQDMVTAGGWWPLANSTTVDDVTLTRLLVALQRKGVVIY